MAISNELMQGLNLLASNDAAKKEQGFNILYRCTYDEVYKKALYIMKNESDALDLTQDVFVNAYKGIGSLQNAEYIHAWLGGIVHNQGMNIFRKRKKEFLVDEDGEFIFEDQMSEDNDIMPESVEERRATANIVQSFIDELPELQRGAIMAYYYEDRKIDEIAALYECSPNTIKSRLNYAKKTLKELAEAHEKKYQYKLCAISPAVIFLAIQALMTTGKYGAAVATAATAAGSAATGVASAAIATKNIIYQRACVSLGIQAYALDSVTAGAAGAASTGIGSATATGVGSAASTGVGTATGVGSAASSTGAVVAGVATKAGLSLGVKIAIGAAVFAVAGGVTTGGILAKKHFDEKRAAMTGVVTEQDENLSNIEDGSHESEDVNFEDTQPREVICALNNGYETVWGDDTYSFSVDEDAEEITVYLNGQVAGVENGLDFAGGYLFVQDENTYLVFTTTWYNDWPTTHVYQRDYASLRSVNKFDGRGLYQSGDITSLRDFVMWMPHDSIGSYVGLYHCKFENGNFIDDLSNVVYEYSHELEVKQSFSATIEGAETILIPGMKIYAQGCNLEANPKEFYITLEDGKRGTIYYTEKTDTWGFNIDGVDVQELFVMVPWAG